jgi:hypothetical protein
MIFETTYRSSTSRARSKFHLVASLIKKATLMSVTTHTVQPPRATASLEIKPAHLKIKFLHKQKPDRGGQTFENCQDLGLRAYFDRVKLARK